MGHGVVFVPELPDSEHLHRQQAEGRLRASINVARGAVAGLGFLFSEADSVSTMELSYQCPNGVPCEVYDAVNLVGTVLSHGEPAPFIAFVAYEIEAGRRREWQAAMEKVHADAGKGDYVAAGHLFGPGRYHGLSEVMSHSSESFYRLLLAATDIAGTRSDVLLVDGKHTRGMGTAAR